MKPIMLLTAITLLAVSCKKSDDNNRQNFNVNITGLEDLGSSFRYEGWLIVNGNPVTTGTFSVNASGQLSATSFEVDKTQLAAATDFVLTIEPFPDTDPAPTATHLLAGAFSGTTAAVTVADSKALGNSFAAASGKYVLATPSDGNNNNEKSGLWFIDLSGGAPATGLNLPVLPAGWKYEGWAVIGGKPVTTGTFTTVSGGDQAAPYSGPMGVPPFPGEDYIINAPSGLTFPTDLSSGLAVISIEPFPDNSPAPFLLKPLLANIPAAAMDHFTYNLNNNTSGFPRGTITR